MKKILVLSVLIGALTGCTDLKSESEVNSEPTIYRYGTVVEIKEGFFKGYRCALIREYSDSLFCKIIGVPDGTRVSEKWETNQNFKKSNVSVVEEKSE
jgi:hypothetical protein